MTQTFDAVPRFEPVFIDLLVRELVTAVQPDRT